MKPSLIRDKASERIDEGNGDSIGMLCKIKLLMGKGKVQENYFEIVANVTDILRFLAYYIFLEGRIESKGFSVNGKIERRKYGRDRAYVKNQNCKRKGSHEESDD